MRQSIAKIAMLLLAVCLLVGLGCGEEETGGLLVADLRVNIGPMKAKLDEVNPPSGCTSPRPDDIGCFTVCKPCVIFYCLEGEWVRLDVHDLADEFCQPLDPGGESPFGCPRDENGFCPAECGFCY